MEKFHLFDQKNVNNGYGIMYSISQDFFPENDTKLFYVRDDMWISSSKDSAMTPKWILDMAEGCKKFSSGLKNVQTEVIQYSFDNELPCCYYAITFSLDDTQIRNTIQIEDDCWYPILTEPYILTIMDIMGEYEYAIGWMHGEQNITLDRDEIDFS